MEVAVEGVGGEGLIGERGLVGEDDDEVPCLALQEGRGEGGVFNYEQLRRHIPPA